MLQIGGGEVSKDIKEQFGLSYLTTPSEQQRIAELETERDTLSQRLAALESENERLRGYELRFKTLEPKLRDCESALQSANTERADLEAALGWLVEAVIANNTIVATPNKEAWLKRAKDAGKGWRSHIANMEESASTWRERAEIAEAERTIARAEVERLKDRERHFAKVLGVADGGRYRADWDGHLEAVIAERDALKQHDQRLQILCAELCGKLDARDVNEASGQAIEVQERMERMESELERYRRSAELQQAAREADACKECRGTGAIGYTVETELGPEGDSQECDFCFGSGSQRMADRITEFAEMEAAPLESLVKAVTTSTGVAREEFEGETIYLERVFARLSAENRRMTELMSKAVPVLNYAILAFDEDCNDGLSEEAQRLKAAIVAAATTVPQPYACHCDLELGMPPDGCVIDEGRPQDCVYAPPLLDAGKDKTACHYWLPVGERGSDGKE